MTKRWTAKLTIFCLVCFGCNAGLQKSRDSFMSGTLHNAKRIIYVSHTGDDKGDGSKARPLATIQKAIDIAQKGDAVKVEPGTYRENIRLRSHVSLVGSGAQVTVLTAEAGNILMAENVIDVSIEGFTFEGRDACENALFCIARDIFSRTPRLVPVTFQKNVVKNFVGSGIDAAYQDITVRENTITGMVEDGIRLSHVRAEVEDNQINFCKRGMSVTQGWAKVINNHVYRCWEIGIHCNYLRSCLIIDNTVIDPGRYGILSQNLSPVIRGNTVKGASDSGIHCFDEGNNSTPRLRGNIITENKRSGVSVRGDTLLDMGRDDDWGYNGVWANGSFDVHNESEIPALAVGNWWGKPLPEADQFKGVVNYSQPLPEQPILQR